MKSNQKNQSNTNSSSFKLYTLSTFTYLDIAKLYLIKK